MPIMLVKILVISNRYCIINKLKKKEKYLIHKDVFILFFLYMYNNKKIKNKTLYIII